MKEKKPTVSIVIRSRNEEKYIGELLKNILHQDYKSWEIILVDSGSTDRTLGIARAFPVKIIQIHPYDFSFGYSLNIGCKQAKGNYFVFISAHAIPKNENWLGELISPFYDEKVGLVYGRQFAGQNTKLSEERDFLENFGPHSRILLEETFCNNANSAIRAKLWQKYRFNEQLPGLEDRDWAERIKTLGYRVAYSSKAVIYHYHIENFSQIKGRYYREALGLKEIFPETIYTTKREIKDYFLGILGDLWFGIKSKKSIRKIIGTLSFRLAQAQGTYKGINQKAIINDKGKGIFILPESYKAVELIAPNKSSTVNKKLKKPDPNEVIIKVAYSAVCPTDKEVASGELSYYRDGLAHYPIVPGHEFSGTVAAVGKNVDGFRIGDPVVGECAVGCGKCENCKIGNIFACKLRTETGVLNRDGSYAEFITLPAKVVHKLPKEISLKEAVFVEPLAVSLRALEKINVTSNTKALIVGAGTIGNLCGQSMKVKGANVSICDRSIERLKLCKIFAEELIPEIPEKLDYNIIAEASGDESLIPELIYRASPGSTILLLGLPLSKKISVEFSYIVGFEKTIVGSVASAPHNWVEAISLLNADKVQVKDLIGKIIPLEEYNLAWNSKPEKGLRYLLKCNTKID